MTLALLLLAPVFLAGVLIGRPAKPRFDMKCLPDPHDERWVKGPESRCSIHSWMHETRQLDAVLVEKGCGVTVDGIWLGKTTKAYANTVMRAQAERMALGARGAN